ncbi:hypothetical protein A2291_07515 [candidate division WOR-1 bacterium RIFOXYB2_FULL_42_35]|uniref:Uncharacterized protein n=1 Tax=candidate division WOR-1 bacterium RIFOXYC2_FULL_41_25 TaxID=1802586 RepID=A0A1F4TKC5_UNCSA|nr:MAG: hypothetical protein A2247_04375 [candidate division WOR-1 bacterium RIFOXYA2_FULL_41_14]OGC22754.1 MAG: hypothetical protein A2291_07515 [candidate division WOR-1 bacterium RIFOXYB2_FULL_42_35]OGC33175.1 MAG: hypothetical protein A2462_06410 [candidate division WOR-1 bacterium RIFOXYC2_FULL_41_25]OGC42244.1 MAG: hypothetical protein A2548_05770 [candidate division WOR-1 bacterium RIFOXYD2_FULL_41_8]
MNYLAETNSALAATINSNNEILVSQEFLEELFAKEWLTGTSYNPFLKETLTSYGVKRRSELVKVKELFIAEMSETTTVHKNCRVMIAQNFDEHDLVILAKLMAAVIPNCPLSLIDEIMAEWMPPQVSNMGVVPYLAHLAKRDYPKAKRMFYRYLAEKLAGSGSGKLFISTVRVYIKKGGEVDFAAMVKNNDKIYDLLMGIFNKYLNLTFQRIKMAEFSYQGAAMSFSELARTQEQEVLAENNNIDQRSSFYKKCFWRKTLKLLQNHAQKTFSLINDDLNNLSVEIVKAVSS